MLPQPTTVFHVQPMTPEPVANRALRILETALREAIEIVSLITFGSALFTVYMMVH